MLIFTVVYYCRCLLQEINITIKILLKIFNFAIDISRAMLYNKLIILRRKKMKKEEIRKTSQAGIADDPSTEAYKNIVANVVKSMRFVVSQKSLMELDEEQKADWAAVEWIFRKAGKLAEVRCAHCYKLFNEFIDFLYQFYDFDKKRFKPMPLTNVQKSQLPKFKNEYEREKERMGSEYIDSEGNITYNHIWPSQK